MTQSAIANYYSTAAHSMLEEGFALIESGESLPTKRELMAKHRLPYLRNPRLSRGRSEVEPSPSSIYGVSTFRPRPGRIALLQFSESCFTKNQWVEDLGVRGYEVVHHDGLPALLSLATYEGDSAVRLSYRDGFVFAEDVTGAAVETDEGAVSRCFLEVNRAVYEGETLLEDVADGVCSASYDGDHVVSHAAAIQEASAARQRVLGEVVAYLGRWFEAEVGRVVCTEDARRGAELGVVGLSALRDAVHSLNPAALATHYLDEAWGAAPEGGYERAAAVEAVRMAMALAAGHLRDVLLEYGLSTDHDGRPDYEEVDAPGGRRWTHTGVASTGGVQDYESQLRLHAVAWPYGTPVDLIDNAERIRDAVGACVQAEAAASEARSKLRQAERGRQRLTARVAWRLATATAAPAAAPPVDL